jgi:hypothetical protein
MSLYADVLLVLAALGNATQNRTNSIWVTLPKEVKPSWVGKITL